MRISLLVAGVVAAQATLGCYRAAEIGAGGNPGPDADSDSDTDVDSVFEIYGMIELAQHTDDPLDDGYLYLTGAFHAEPFDPSAAAFLETRTAPDGSECDIYLFSGMLQEPDPVEPLQVDGGAIRAGNGLAWPETLVTTFEDGTYVQDWRSEWDQEHPMPSWLVPGPFEVSIECDGEDHVAPFAEALSVSAIPALTSPGDQSPVEIDEDQNYVFEWDPNGAAEIVFTLSYNMDWDNTSFVCRPEATTGQIRIPLAWIDELTWGGAGEVSVASLEEVELAQEDALIVLRVTRGHRVQYVVAFD